MQALRGARRALRAASSLGPAFWSCAACAQAALIGCLVALVEGRPFLAALLMLAASLAFLALVLVAGRVLPRRGASA